MSLTIRKMQKYLKEKYYRTKPEDVKNTQRYFAAHSKPQFGIGTYAYRCYEHKKAFTRKLCFGG